MYGLGMADKQSPTLNLFKSQTHNVLFEYGAGLVGAGVMPACFRVVALSVLSGSVGRLPALTVSLPC